MSSPKGVQNNHTAAPVTVARQQTTPELSGTFRTLPPVPTRAHTGTLRRVPEPSGTASATYTTSRTPVTGPSEIFRNLPKPASAGPTPANNTASSRPFGFRMIKSSQQLVWMRLVFDEASAFLGTEKSATGRGFKKELSIGLFARALSMEHVWVQDLCRAEEGH